MSDDNKFNDDIVMDITNVEDRRISNSNYFGFIPIFILVVIVFVRVTFILCKSYGQKTRTPPQRRMYVGTRARQSLSQTEPTIYVSPNNLPPPPKYECLAPPSYEEVVGVHYPQYQQPITQPITAAMAQNHMPITTAMAQSQAPITTGLAQTAQSSRNSTDATVITVTSEVRSSVQATSS